MLMIRPPLAGRSDPPTMDPPNVDARRDVKLIAEELHPGRDEPRTGRPRTSAPPPVPARPRSPPSATRTREDREMCRWCGRIFRMLVERAVPGNRAFDRER